MFLSFFTKLVEAEKKLSDTHDKSLNLVVNYTTNTDASKDSFRLKDSSF